MIHCIGHATGPSTIRFTKHCNRGRLSGSKVGHHSKNVTSYSELALHKLGICSIEFKLYIIGSKLHLRESGVLPSFVTLRVGFANKTTRQLLI